jgi:hypothetical protein
MEVSVKSYLAGVLSGILVSYVTVYSIAVTAAIVMPREFPIVLWQVAVVFGLGAFLPALVIYLLTLLVSRPNLIASLTGFCVAVIVGMCFFTGLTFAGNALSAIILGVLVSTTIACSWSNNSFKADGSAAA